MVIKTQLCLYGIKMCVDDCSVYYTVSFVELMLISTCALFRLKDVAYIKSCRLTVAYGKPCCADLDRLKVTTLCPNFKLRT